MSFSLNKLFLSLLLVLSINGVAMANDGSLLNATYISCGDDQLDSNPFVVMALEDFEHVTHLIRIDGEVEALVINKKRSTADGLVLDFTMGSDHFKTALISGNPVEMTLFPLDEGPVVQKLECEVEY